MLKTPTQICPADAGGTIVALALSSPLQAELSLWLVGVRFCERGGGRGVGLVPRVVVT